MDIKIPEVGESIYEVTISRWHKQDGDKVQKDDLLCEVETDKITLELNAETGGVLHLQKKEGDVVKIGEVIARLDETVAAVVSESESEPVEELSRHQARETTENVETEISSGTERAEVVAFTNAAPISSAEEVLPVLPEKSDREYATARRETRKPMSAIRRKIAERLVAVRQQTAMLTTFNDVDMSKIKELRGKYRVRFQERYGVSLGIVSFFVKAAVEALEEFPEVNAFIESDEIVYHEYKNIGIAVGSEKGLVVPVIKDAENLHFFEIEKVIDHYVGKIRSNQLALTDLKGGTFTISNGGIYGSMLSTPILNPPQSAILGMHAIQDRPVVRDGEIVIRPMMYLALSYDHRIIDGRQAVGFLKKIKEYIEEPEQMLLDL